MQATLSPLDEGALDIPLTEQIAEVKRELAMREKVYPSQVRMHRMTQATATKQVRTMRAVLNTLLDKDTGQVTELSAENARLTIVLSQCEYALRKAQELLDANAQKAGAALSKISGGPNP